MQTFRRIIVFILLNIGVSFGCRFLLVGEASVPRRFVEFENGNYNSAIIGASLSLAGLDPVELEVKESDKVYNMSIGGGPFHNQYYILKALNEINQLERVFLDIYYPFWTDEQYDDNHVEWDLSLMKILSLEDKIKYFYDNFLFDDYNNTFFPYRLTSGKIFNMPCQAMDNLKLLVYGKNANKTSSEEYQGFFPLSDMPENYPQQVYRQFSNDLISDRAIEDFDKIVKYCEDNDIELICVKSALPPLRLQNENHNADHDYFTELCQSRDVPFYDMNYIKYNLFPRKYSDYNDSDGHMLGFTAKRQSELLRQIMLSDNPDEFFVSEYSEVLTGIANYECVNI